MNMDEICGSAVFIVNPNGKCLHLHGAEDSNGAAVTLWEKVDQANLKWEIQKAQDPWYYIVSCSSGRVLHNHGGGNENGAPCTTWEQCGQDNLKVRFVPTTQHGYYYIQFKDSGKFVHIHGGGDENGTQISQWEQVNQPNLWWKIEL